MEIHYFVDIEHSSLNLVTDVQLKMVDQTQAFILAPSRNPTKASVNKISKIYILFKFIYLSWGAGDKEGAERDSRAGYQHRADKGLDLRNREIMI